MKRLRALGGGGREGMNDSNEVKVRERMRVRGVQRMRGMDGGQGYGYNMA